MSERHSTKTSLPGTPARVKPEKPSPDFPLFAHACGQWVKKIRGRMHYFGKWDDPDAALAKYRAEADDLHAGKSPASRDSDQGLTVRILCGKFLTTKKTAMTQGALSPRTYADYGMTCKRMQKVFRRERLVNDLGPADFARYRKHIGKTWGNVTIFNEINRVRVVFSYARSEGLLKDQIIFGEGFKRPSAKVLRKHRRERGVKAFSADEIRDMIAAAKQPLKAMILLAINCGFGNEDIGTLPLTALDLDRGWVDYSRPKTEIDRRCAIWPETRDALRKWLEVRPEPKTEKDAKLVFLTRYGVSWAKDGADNPITKETRKLLDQLKIAGNRNFYALRHTFQTIGDESKDFIAVRKIMGHAGGNDIGDVYREFVSDDRLAAVTEHVRKWLFNLRPETS